MGSAPGTVLVTGATGGLGGATVRRLDELGWRVFAGARDLDAARDLGRDRVIPVRLDLSDEGSIAEARDEVSSRLDDSGLDALINVAGIVVQGPLELVPAHALRRQFEVNVIGQVVVTQAFLPLLRRARGRVINIGGAAGRVCLPMLGPIAASKAALESLTDALRMELKHQGVDVSIIAPGLLQTQIHQKSEAAARRDGYAGGRDAQQIYARAIAASDEALARAAESPVEIAVSAIVKALTADKPATRYLVGRDARALVLLRRLPDRLRDRLLMWNRGLRRELFAPAAAQDGGERPADSQAPPTRGVSPNSSL